MCVCGCAGYGRRCRGRRFRVKVPLPGGADAGLDAFPVDVRRDLGAVVCSGVESTCSTPSTRHLLDGVAMPVPHRGHVIAEK